ncbi:putative ribonuclease H-like domain-containing protein, partial [Tanacetum coccineum]
NKKDERGIIVRNKARLVAQGYTQEKGVDYDEVFVPVTRIEAMRLFLAYSSFMGLIVYQMDVKSAFLYGTIEEEVYVCQPPSLEDPQFPDKVYKVEKALYSLHQALRAWFETLSTYLLENGFKRGTIDKTLFIKKDKSDILLVQLYVDDIIFGSTKKSLCVEFEQMMHKRIQISSMWELTFFLRLQVKQKDDGIVISQDKYVADILKKFDFATVKTTSTPIETNKALLKDEEAEDVKRIFKYLKGQPKLSLWYPRDSPFDLDAFSDSDYAGASLDKKSTTGDGISDEFGAKTGSCKVNAARKDLVLLGEIEGEGSGQPSEPQPPSSTAPPSQEEQSGGPPKKVGEEAVHKELGDRMERAATTAASLDAEHDSEAIEGTISQTRSERVPTPSYDLHLLGGNTPGSDEERIEQDDLMNFVPPTPYDSPLSGGHTPRTDEGSPNINELMAICTNLLNKVLALETSKTAQDLEIKKLKNKVRKLEKKLRARTPGMKLFKIGTSKRKSLDEEYVSKQGRKSDKIKPMFDDSDFVELDVDNVTFLNFSWREDGYCNGGNLPGAYIVGNTLRYQSLEWYDALKDSELKEEALRNKAIMEGLINEDVESNNEDNERYELCGNETHDFPVCNIRRFEMIKYSFGQDEEYVAVKENEYEDLMSTSEDAWRAYH